MRQRLLLLLVAVLLLRGWGGEAIAGQMLAQQLQAGVVAAQLQDAVMSHEHCAQAASDPATGDTASEVSCTLCQACSLHALPVVMVQATQPQPCAPRDEGAAPFASADTYPVSKPPIA
ncbi:MAG: hypothetical protein HY854_09675 [Burkholderiales bacterium]|nr:hypothetical protein [Burkholderiales bacterium]